MNEATDISELDFDTPEVMCDKCDRPAIQVVTTDCGASSLACFGCWNSFVRRSKVRPSMCRCGWTGEAGQYSQHYDAKPFI